METIIIAERLLKLRGEQSRKDVAKAVGITPNALCNYEHGTRIPQDCIKVKIANYYGQTVQQIFYD